jgi:hypothetical protein
MHKPMTLGLIGKRAALAAVAAMGLWTSTATAGGIGIDIRIGAPPPPIVRETVVVDEAWVVGPRKMVYDADLRLRLAQAAEYKASQELEATRAREGELAAAMDDQDRLLVNLRHEVADREAAVGAASGRLAQAEKDVASAGAEFETADRRAIVAKDDLVAVRRSGAPDFDAASKLHRAEAAASAARADLDVARGRLEQIRRADGPALLALDAARARLHEAEARTGRLPEELAAAHDIVFAARQRLHDASDEVYAALAARDEGLWLCHRDEILAGTFDFERCGFHVDLAVFNAHRRDPEFLHTYFVHDVGYWRERPVLVQERIIEVDHVVDIGRIRSVARVREVEKVRVVETFEINVKVEERRRVAEVVKVDREVFVKEKTEREVAVREGRKPQLTQFVSHPSAEAKLRKEDTKLKEANATITEQAKDAKEQRVARRAQDAELTKLKADDAKKTEELKKTEEARAGKSGKTTAAATDAPSGKSAKHHTDEAEAAATETGKSGKRRADPTPAKEPESGKSSRGKDGKDADGKPKDETARTETSR